MFLERLIRINKDHLPKGVDKKDFLKTNMPIEDNKDQQPDLSQFVEENTLFEEKKESPKRILKDNDIFIGVASK